MENGFIMVTAPQRSLECYLVGRAALLAARCGTNPSSSFHPLEVCLPPQK